MKTSIKTYMIFICVLLTAGWLDPFKDAVSAGNKTFHEKKYPQAKQKYDEAENYAPDEEAKRKLAFNKGTAEYMAGSYEEALSFFNYSMQSREPEVQKKTFFNMGNSYLRMGKKREAFEAYSSALKIDPDYMPAKKNIEYLQKEEKDKDKKNEQNKQGNENKDKENRDKENKDGDENQNSKNDGDDNKSRDKNKQEQNAGDKNDESSKAQIGREQVKNILDSMKNKPVQRTKEKSDGRPYLENDW